MRGIKTDWQVPACLDVTTFDFELTPWQKIVLEEARKRPEKKLLLGLSTPARFPSRAYERYLESLRRG
jgi:hypothetical protein